MPTPSFLASTLDDKGNRAYCRDGHAVIWPGGMFSSTNGYNAYGFCAGGQCWRQEAVGWGTKRTYRLTEVEPSTAWRRSGGDFRLNIVMASNDTALVKLGDLTVNFSIKCRGQHPHAGIPEPHSLEQAQQILVGLKEMGWIFTGHEYALRVGTETTLAISCPRCIKETADLEAALAALVTP